MAGVLSASEYEEWKAVYEEIDPFGSQREDLRAGTIAAPLINLWVKRGGAKAKPSDWIMEFGTGSKPRQSIQQMQAICRMFAAAHQGSKKKRPPDAKKGRR